MLKQLKNQHREIARLSFEGFSPSEIAERLEMSYQTIHGILKDPLCKGYMEGLSDRADTTVIDVRKQLAEMNLDALNVMKDILDPNGVNIPYSTKLNAAKDILDRTGHKPVEQSINATYHFTTEDILEMQERQRKLEEDININ